MEDKNLDEKVRLGTSSGAPKKLQGQLDMHLMGKVELPPKQGQRAFSILLTSETDKDGYPP